MKVAVGKAMTAPLEREEGGSLPPYIEACEDLGELDSSSTTAI